MNTLSSQDVRLQVFATKGSARSRATRAPHTLRFLVVVAGAYGGSGVCPDQ